MISNYEYDYSIKTLIIGDSGVGKSSIMNQFVESKYNDSFQSTIGVDYKTVFVNIQDKSIKFLIWDTAGQERFKSITKIYYRGAQVIIFVFDITDRISFDNIPNWIKETEQTAPNSCLKILIGNKCDFDNQMGFSNNQTNKKRQVSKEDALEMVKTYGLIGYHETSAKTNKGIEDFFIETGNYYLKNGCNDKFDCIESKNKDEIKIDKKSNNKNDNWYNKLKCFC